MQKQLTNKNKQILKTRPQKTNKPQSASKLKDHPRKQYLHALYQLTNASISNHPKKSCNTRDLKSGLTLPTQAYSKNLDEPSRSKSSISKSYKKHKGKLQQIDNFLIQSCTLVTEQSLIQFSGNNSRVNLRIIHENYNIKPVQFIKKDFQYNKVICAIKIQRAWRKYQTLQIVRKRTESCKKSINLMNLGNLMKNKQKNLTIKLTESKLEEKSKRKNKLPGNKSRQNLNNQQIQNYTTLQKKQLCTKNIDMALNLIKQYRNNTLINTNTLKNQNIAGDANKIQKYQINQKEIQEKYQISEKQNSIAEQQHYHQQHKPHIDSTEKIEETNFQTSQNMINFHSQLADKLKIIEFEDSKISQIFSQDDQLQIFPQTRINSNLLKCLQKQKKKEINLIDKEIIANNFDKLRGLEKKREILDFYKKQTKKVEANKALLLKALTNLKKHAIKLNKHALQNGQALEISQVQLKKSYSVGNNIVNSITKFLEISDKTFNTPLSESPILYSPVTHQIQANKSSNLEWEDSIELTQKEEQQYFQILNNVESNPQLISLTNRQEISDQLQIKLLNEFVKQIYLDDGIYTLLANYVEEPYRFKKISDQQIIEMYDQLVYYMPNELQALRLINQKINPTSSEILKIIRDMDYEMDQYELIIPEEAYTEYRRQIQKQYTYKHQNTKQKSINISSLIDNADLQSKIRQREDKKIQKNKKLFKFERDSKIIYMKSVFNCLNEYFIDIKSSNCFTNSRSSIGPGELTCALKQYNKAYGTIEFDKLVKQVQTRLLKTINMKCIIPDPLIFDEVKDFTLQLNTQLEWELDENQYKWVNYMDEVMEIWLMISACILNDLIKEVTSQFLIFSK